MSPRRECRPGASHGPAVQITCTIPRQGTPRLRGVLEGLGVCEYSLQHARRTLLVERRAPFAPRGSHALSEELVDVVRFHAQRTHEARIIDILAGAWGFGEPGRGSIVSREVGLTGHDPSPCAAAPGRAARPRGEEAHRGAAAVSCIVPRGAGAAIARVALEAGLCAPVVTYGQGSGRRDRLGLIRITIPVDKEIVTLLLSPHDVGEAFRLVAEVMQLDRPGAGFGFWYPLSRGVLDSRIWLGRQPHIASMEQVIAALDAVTGGTAWRRKAARRAYGGERRAALASLTIHGTEGETEPVVRAVLAEGAGGATLVRFVRERPAAPGIPSAAREASELIVEERAVDRMRRAAVAAGLLECDGWLETAPVGGSSGFRAP